MKNILSVIIAVAVCVVIFCACGKVEKNISVIVREKGSGTREAFDRVINDGEHYLEERNADGKKVYNTSKTAIEQTKTGNVLSSVAADVNAIGYISIGSVNDSIKVIRVNGVSPSEQSVLSGEYRIVRPFVLMSNARITLSENTADFMSYLKSDAARDFSRIAGCIFLSDPEMRANAGSTPIELTEYTKKDALSSSEKIVIRGSTSLEKFIIAAAKAYSELYGIDATSLFDIQLEGSSVGQKAVENDKSGNVIGLSSASVVSDGIESFNVCLDAIAVIVNRDCAVSDLSVSELYSIFSGKITKFSELE